MSLLKIAVDICFLSHEDPAISKLDLCEEGGSISTVIFNSNIEINV